MASSERNYAVGNWAETQPQQTRLPHRLAPQQIATAALAGDPAYRRRFCQPYGAPIFPQPVKPGLPPENPS